MGSGSFIERKVQEDLARRSLHGTWAQPWITVIAFTTTDFAVRAPVVMWSAAGLIVALSILRLILLKRMPELYPVNPKRWKSLHVLLITFYAAFWGFMAAYAVSIYGYHNENALIFILCNAGVALGTVILLVHDNRLMRLSLALLYAPLVVSLLFFGGGRRLGLTLTVVTYLFYIMIQAKRLHEAYWLQIQDNHDLHTIARHDSLTRLPNRLYMQELMETAMTQARRARKQMALMYIDLDGFKEVNDRFSHEVGDLLLCEVARRLAACIESNAVVARLGGDEFTILLTDCDSAETVAGVANRVLQSAQNPVSVKGFMLSCSASIGVSLFPGDADATDHLVRAADLAMYVAKSAGKNQVRFFAAIEKNTADFETYAEAASARTPALGNVSISQESSIARLA